MRFKKLISCFLSVSIITLGMPFTTLAKDMEKVKRSGNSSVFRKIIGWGVPSAIVIYTGYLLLTGNSEKKNDNDTKSDVDVSLSEDICEASGAKPKEKQHEHQSSDLHVVEVITSSDDDDTTGPSDSNTSESEIDDDSDDETIGSLDGSSSESEVDDDSDSEDDSPKTPIMCGDDPETCLENIPPEQIVEFLGEHLSRKDIPKASKEPEESGSPKSKDPVVALRAPHAMSASDNMSIITDSSKVVAMISPEMKEVKGSMLFGNSHLVAADFSGATKIGASAFRDCVNLSSVKISPNLTEIQKLALSGCKALKTFTIPDSTEAFGTDIFSGWGPTQTIVLPREIYDNDFRFRWSDDILTAFEKKDLPPIARRALPSDQTYIDWSIVFRGCKANIVDEKGNVYSIYRLPATFLECHNI